MRATALGLALGYQTTMELTPASELAATSTREVPIGLNLIPILSVLSSITTSMSMGLGPDCRVMSTIYVRGPSLKNESVVILEANFILLTSTPRCQR